MKAVKIRLLACWDGYCGTCRDVRPLVLTQTGRFSLRSWWAGASDEDRPLTMTCRVCGTGVHVPHEEDDPELQLDDDLDEELEPIAAVAAPEPVASTDVPAPAAQAAAADEQLVAARTALATALAAVVHRSAAPAPAPAAAVIPPRAGDHDDTDQALRLLAAGLETSHLIGEPALY